VCMNPRARRHSFGPEAPVSRRPGRRFSRGPKQGNIMESVAARSFLKGFSVPLVAVGVGVMPALAGPPASVHLRLVALTGQPAPGAAPGALFATLAPASFDGAPGIGADSTMGFGGVLSDGTAGFWLDHGAGAALLALSGTPAPGTEPGVV